MTSGNHRHHHGGEQPKRRLSGEQELLMKLKQMSVESRNELAFMGITSSRNNQPFATDGRRRISGSRNNRRMGSNSSMENLGGSSSKMRPNRSLENLKRWSALDRNDSSNLSGSSLQSFEILGKALLGGSSSSSFANFDMPISERSSSRNATW